MDLHEEFEVCHLGIVVDLHHCVVNHIDVSTLRREGVSLSEEIVVHRAKELNLPSVAVHERSIFLDARFDIVLMPVLDTWIGFCGIECRSAWASFSDRSYFSANCLYPKS